MKRAPLLCLAIFGLFLGSFARPVDLETAKVIASKFMGTHDLQASATYSTDKDIAALYVFNTTDGFVIVSADDCESPIIAYSHEGRFDPDNVPVQMEEYLQGFVARIQYGIENHIAADEATSKQWELINATGRLNDIKNAKSVEPLLTEKWHQGCLYNSLCPTLSKLPCDHAEVGCVAVAMGQIMHYWKYPATGFGTHSYNNLGVSLSADFGSTTYDWEHMPDSLTDASSETEIEAVATLLYHCGVSVDMYYTTNGSGASSLDVPNAMVRNFSYSKQIHFEKRSKYNDEEWLALLKGNLDLQRPVYCNGSGNHGGHAFVCDGYDGNDMLHFNWGWGVANGYFAMGNLNPNGYTFNRNQSAILDIIPQYEPCHVFATAFPATAGTIEGEGEYHIGAQCTLTVTPAPDIDFLYWKRDGMVVSNALSYTFSVEDDTINFEAYFCQYPVGNITANYSPEAGNPNSTSINLTWGRADTEWILLNKFDIDEELGGMATDGEFIYVTYAEWNNPPFEFGKYTMDGDLVERFDLDKTLRPVCLAFDGSQFYCNGGETALSMIHRIDFDSKTVIDSTEMGFWFGAMTYDPEYDGFWLDRDYQVVLSDRQGQRLKVSPTLSEYIYGTAYYTAQDGNPHLLLTKDFGIYDYDINNNFIFDRPLLAYDESSDSMGACMGQYDGKEALFVVIGNTVHIYEVRSNLSHIIGYRLYRADSEENVGMLYDGFSGSSYTDETWGNLVAGWYRYGISMIYANGIESNIIWSDFIEKTDYGVGESHGEPTESAVQKVFEDGQIVIIKNGKRYTVMGQQLN